ncbi:MAG TPA: serine/threonine-protein kinase [Nocardioidaceae bacterium]|nr:serine/threonine-protein kinase [Nocardioidaceae bacterium]
MSRAPCVGGYRLLARIGEGGMGVVHLAEGPDGRQVALKVLRPNVVGDDENRARLAREVDALHRVDSPRVAGVVDADPWGETPFVATRYVPGPTLHEHVEQHGPLTGADLVRVAAGLAEAVIAVHTVGVLHRDIKPSNVLLEGRDPVLIDFGLARAAEDTRLTQVGWLLGTPGYLAPEILFGEDATTASDVHSWAATVAYAASGQPPFGTGPAVAVMDRVRRGEHDLSAVPGFLRPLLTACLAPDPADRPETAAVLAALAQPAPAAAGPGTPTTVTGPVPPRTRPITVVAPAVLPAPPVPPAVPAADPRPRLVPLERWRPPPRGLPRVQRGAVLGGLFATVTTAFAHTPYLCLTVLAPLVLLVRTLSWTTDSARARQHLRGRRRWYDGALTVLSTPWYLVVAVAGTLVLMVWAVLVAFATGFAYLLFGGPTVPGMLVMGAVLSLSLWWGPHARRLREPTRRVVLALTGRTATGWVAVGLVVLAAAVGLALLLTGGVQWDPRPGAPWRPGTLLGGLAGWL